MASENSEVFSPYFYENTFFCIENSGFRSDLKLADVTLAFKKKPKTSKGNYRAISILLNISEVYERYLYKQIRFFLIKSYLNISVDYAKDLISNPA